MEYVLPDPESLPLALSPADHRRCRELLRRHRRGAMTGWPQGERVHVPGEELRLCAAARKGDRAAQDAIVDRLACLPAMVRLKQQRMGARLSAHEVEDVTQSVLLAVWGKLEQFDGRVPLQQWAFGFIVVEILKMLERSARRRAVVRVGEAPEPESPESQPQLHDPERLAAALLREEEADRAIVRGKHFEGLTFDEIAARSGMPVNTVKTRYYRCLRRLKAWLEKQEAS